MSTVALPSDTDPPALENYRTTKEAMAYRAQLVERNILLSEKLREATILGPDETPLSEQAENEWRRDVKATIHEIQMQLHRVRRFVISNEHEPLDSLREMVQLVYSWIHVYELQDIPREELEVIHRANRMVKRFGGEEAVVDSAAG